MDAKTKKFLFDLYTDVIVYGRKNRVVPADLERDKRKAGKVARDLEKTGYLATHGGEYVVTGKVWDETPSESVNLTEIWDASRKDGWNQRKNFPFVRFNLLTDGQKKSLVACATFFEWRLCLVDPLRYEYKLHDGDLSGPVDTPDLDMGEKMMALRKAMTETLAVQKRGGYWPNFEVVVTCAALRVHAEKTLAKEKFDSLFGINLRWGLETLGVVSKDDAKEAKTSEELDWVLGGGAGGNLGTDPEKWGEKLAEKISDAREGVVRLQKRLDSLEKIRAGVEAFGGWEKFRADMAEKMKAELEAKEPA